MKVCPNCGATLNTAKLSCESCGTDIPKEGGIEYGDFIRRFGATYRKVLADESKDHRENPTNNDELMNSAAMIDSLFIPAEKDSLIQLTAFVAGQIKSAGNNINIYNISSKGVILSAWIGKANEIETKLTLMGALDSQLKKTLTTLESSIDFGEKKLKEVRRNSIIFVGGTFIALLVIYIFIYFFGD
jgi:hypothetical protein